MDVRIETIDPIRVVYFRGTGPYAQMMPPLWKRMGGYAARRGLANAESMFLTIAWSDPRTTPPEEIYGDPCVSVGPDFEPDEDAQVQTITGGPYAVARYVGPYEGLSTAWGELCGAWMTDNGRQFRPGPPFEVYRNNPADTPPAELVTDLFAPVQP